MSEEEYSEEELDDSEFETEPTVNLNQYFKEVDVQEKEKQKTKRKPTSKSAQVDSIIEEQEDSVSVSKFNEQTEQRAIVEAKKMENIENITKHAIRNSIRTVDLALGYDGTAVDILEDPENVKFFEDNLYKNPEIKRYSRTIYKMGGAVAALTVVLNYIDKRRDCIERINGTSPPPPQVGQKRAIESAVPPPPPKIQVIEPTQSEGDRFLKDMLAKK